MLVVGLLGMWAYSMDTLSQVIVAVIVTILIAIPLGILAARNDTFEAALRPILDLLQTIPPFVYLVPVIILFNIGRVPGIIASVVYALPPGIRLTNLGIRQVSPEAIEASTAFGASVTQTLRKVQLPLALPAIMLGINQVVMMVLAMVIIAGLVGGGGLGLEAVIGLAKNQTGRGIEAGLAIVIMAMIMDRMTQAWVKKRQRYLKQEQ
jgi:glycine betaine/proline transport system permease protein